MVTMQVPSDHFFVVRQPGPKIAYICPKLRGKVHLGAHNNALHTASIYNAYLHFRFRYRGDQGIARQRRGKGTESPKIYKEKRWVQKCSSRDVTPPHLASTSQSSLPFSHFVRIYSETALSGLSRATSTRHYCNASITKVPVYPALHHVCLVEGHYNVALHLPSRRAHPYHPPHLGSYFFLHVLANEQTVPSTCIRIAKAVEGPAIQDSWPTCTTS